MDQALTRGGRVRPAGASNPHVFIQGAWERMILEITQAQMTDYTGALSVELTRLRTEGWKLTYSLNSAEGKTLYFKRPLPRAPRRLKETIMW